MKHFEEGKLSKPKNITVVNLGKKVKTYPYKDVIKHMQNVLDGKHDLIGKKELEIEKEFMRFLKKLGLE